MCVTRYSEHPRLEARLFRMCEAGPHGKSNVVDQTNGGYLESLHDGKFTPSGEKFLTLQGRQLWFFSTLARAGIEEKPARAAAKTGFDFLEGHMRDRRYGGYPG